MSNARQSTTTSASGAPVSVTPAAATSPDHPALVPWQRAILEVWALLWALAGFFAGLQVLLMADRWWLVVFMVLLQALFYLPLRVLIRGLGKGSVVARVFGLIIAGLHLVYPVYEAVNGAAPGPDSIILCVVAACLCATMYPAGRNS